MNGTVNLVRREIVETTRRLVVKVGTNVLSRPDDTLDIERIERLVEQIHRIRQTGRQVVVVSSGAVGAGLGVLGMKERPRDLRRLQAAAATGQARLMRCYNDCMAKFGYHAAQLLLTANDFKSRARYLNVRNTLLTLFEFGVIPVVNENDTVSVEEIKFGDNDHLAAMVTNLLESTLLIILSTVDGLLDGDPADPHSKVVSVVANWDEALMRLAVPTRDRRGTGGMKSKLQAARMATAVGENVIVANGTRANVLDQILAGEEVGTLFLAQGASIPAWKRWIGYTVAPKGKLVLDDGAHKAIRELGRSLLAIGITAVVGEFHKGEVISLVDKNGQEFARGLTNYAARDARAIAGKRTSEIVQTLGRIPYEEVVHRDNLVVIG